MSISSNYIGIFSSDRFSCIITSYSLSLLLYLIITRLCNNESVLCLNWYSHNHLTNQVSQGKILSSHSACRLFFLGPSNGWLQPVMVQAWFFLFFQVMTVEVHTAPNFLDVLTVEGRVDVTGSMWETFGHSTTAENVQFLTWLEFRTPSSPSPGTRRCSPYAVQIEYRHTNRVKPPHFIWNFITFTLKMDFF